MGKQKNQLQVVYNSTYFGVKKNQWYTHSAIFWAIYTGPHSHPISLHFFHWVGHLFFGPRDSVSLAAIAEHRQVLGDVSRRMLVDGSVFQEAGHTRKINIEPEHGEMEDDVHFPGVYSQVPCKSSGVYNNCNLDFFFLWCFTDFTMGNYHQTTICENMFYFFQASKKQIQSI